MRTGSRGSKWRRRLLALALGWALVELVLLPLVAVWAPLRLRVRLPAPLRVLGERSKDGFLPREYVLVLGDSYAEGHGDWLTEAMRLGGDPPYQATHVLHELTGRDVLTFGSGGADNVSASAFMVSKRCAALLRLGLGVPRDVFLYFYEGNDLNENLKLARKRFGLAGRGSDGFLEADLEAAVAARGVAGTRKGIFGTLFGPYLLLDLLAGHSAGGLHGAERRQLLTWESPPAVLPEENVFQVAGRMHQFFPSAQGPALELTGEELDLALALLEHSARWVCRRFPTARTRLVYLPAPLSCYQILSPSVRVQTYEGRGDVYPASLPWQRTDELRGRVAALAAALGIGFVDATDELRSVARGELVHGPGDAKHFNRAGYTALARVLARAL